MQILQGKTSPSLKEKIRKQKRKQDQSAETKEFLFNSFISKGSYGCAFGFKN